MRSIGSVALLSALVAASGASQAAPKAAWLEVAFGATKYLPLTPTPKLAGDYVADAKTVVPDAVRKCGGANARYEPATDGGAVVVFSTTGSEQKTATCIKNLLPQVRVQSAISVEIPCAKPQAGYVCHVTQYWR